MNESEKLNPSERIIVAADFDPRMHGGISGAHRQVLELAGSLRDLGVYIKVNSILRAVGYSLIEELHGMGLRVFADLKLNDIPNTMEHDAAMLLESKPEILTVMCSSGIEGMQRVQNLLDGITEVLGVTILTSLDDDECDSIFRRTPVKGVLHFASMAQKAGLPGLILSPLEAAMVREDQELTLGLNTPGIRPKWSLVANDDQARVLTPEDAIRAGVKRVVIGRPITQAASPRDAVLRTVDEIECALSETN